MAWTRRRAALACAPSLAAAIVIAAQLGVLAGAWDMMPRDGYTYAVDPAIPALGWDAPRACG